jgi:hypothetical protein
VVIGGFLLSLAFMFPVLLSHNLTVVALCLSVAFFFAESTIGPFWAIPMDIAAILGISEWADEIGSDLAAALSPQVALCNTAGHGTRTCRWSSGLVRC